jgi:hypothetical protein
VYYQTKRIIDIIERNPTQNVNIVLDSLGREDLLCGISAALKTLIVVDEERMQTLRILEQHHILPNVASTSSSSTSIVDRYFTCNPDEGFIAVVSKHQPREFRENTITIRPSGWSCQRRPVSSNTLPSSGVDPTPKSSVYYVPYSLHSSFSELEQFLSFVRPRTMFPLLRASAADFMQHFAKYASPGPTPLPPLQSFYSSRTVSSSSESNACTGKSTCNVRSSFEMRRWAVKCKHLNPVDDHAGTKIVVDEQPELFHCRDPTPILIDVEDTAIRNAINMGMYEEYAEQVVDLEAEIRQTISDSLSRQPIVFGDSLDELDPVQCDSEMAHQPTPNQLHLFSVPLAKHEPSRRVLPALGTFLSPYEQFTLFCY